MSLPRHPQKDVDCLQAGRDWRISADRTRRRIRCLCVHTAKSVEYINPGVVFISNTKVYSPLNSPNTHPQQSIHPRREQEEDAKRNICQKLELLTRCVVGRSIKGSPPPPFIFIHHHPLLLKKARVRPGSLANKTFTRAVRRRRNELANSIQKQPAA